MISAGDKADLFVENVASKISLPKEQKINLRQGKVPLPFVAIVNSETSATVSIDTTGLAVGEYILSLESYDFESNPP